MPNVKMSFEEINAEKEKFLELYGLKDDFKKSGCSWDELMAIGADYSTKRDGEYLEIIHKYIAQISAFENVHSYRYRIKRTDSLLAKIIRKSAAKNATITCQNYFKEISDLLGIRILYIFKEDYWPVHLQIMEAYKDQLAENVHLKLRDGDDEKTYEAMLQSYDIKVEKKKAYRSIHYTIYANENDIKNSPKLEIQTRTIFEEGWSEINHKLVYKRDSFDFSHLERTSGILSELVGSCDAVGSLMKFIHDEAITPNDSGTVQQAETNTDKVGDAIRKFLMQ